MAGERQECINTFPAGAANPYDVLCEEGEKPWQDTLVEERTRPVKCKPRESRHTSPHVERILLLVIQSVSLKVW